MPEPGVNEVPCLTCQRDYRKPHACDEPDYCACDRWREHVSSPWRQV